jgi:hypothetical protein
MTKQSIPDTVKREVAEIIEQFNQSIGQPHMAQYVPRYSGRYLYLDRADFMDSPGKICRLTYSGDLTSWDFAIYKNSTNRYDPDEWLIPGLEHLDGTLEGAMKAGLEAYPV